MTLHTKDNHTSPLVVTIDNKTRYAEEYLWTFEGGDAVTSTKKDPGTVTFSMPEEHQITLKALSIRKQSTKHIPYKLIVLSMLI